MFVDAHAVRPGIARSAERESCREKSRCIGTGTFLSWCEWVGVASQNETINLTIREAGHEALVIDRPREGLGAPWCRSCDALVTSWAAGAVRVKYSTGSIPAPSFTCAMSLTLIRRGDRVDPGLIAVVAADVASVIAP